MNEEYVKIKDYPYYISNMGNVKNKTGRILKPKITNKGYLSVALYNANGKRWCYIHRLVAMHFLINSELKPNVNHIDCNPLNNNVDNLEWCTQSENIKYSDSLGRCKIRDYRYCESGKGHGRSCRIICKKGDNIQIFESINIAGMKLGISHQNIFKCLKGERKTAKGYSFRRA